MITSRDIAQTLMFANKKDDVDTKKLVSNTLAYLESKKLTHLITEVSRILDEEAKKELERESVVVETPYEISDNTLREISEKLLSDAKEKPQQVLNEGLIGGFVVKHGGVIYDASLKRKIELLKNKLKK